MATGGTQRFLAQHGVGCEKVNKVLEGRPHIVDAMKNGSVQLVFNTTDGQNAIADFEVAAPRRPDGQGPLLHDGVRAAWLRPGPSRR